MNTRLRRARLRPARRPFPFLSAGVSPALVGALLFLTPSGALGQDPAAVLTLQPGARGEVQVELYRGARVLDDGGTDVTALFRVEFTAGRGGSLPLAVAVDARARPGRYRVELVPARRGVPAMELVLVVTGPAAGPEARPGERPPARRPGQGDPAPDTSPPTAVLDVPGTVEQGADFELSGERSADVGGQVVRWRFTRTSGPGASTTMPLNQPVETSQPRFTVTGGLSAGLHTFRLVVVDDAGNQSQPAEAQLRAIDSRAPTAVLDAPATVLLGQPVVLSGERSSDVPPGTVVRWRFTRLAGPGTSATMPLNQAIETDQPTFTLTGSPPLAAGVHRFELRVVDAAGNESAPAAARVTVVDR